RRRAPRELPPPLRGAPSESTSLNSPESRQEPRSGGREAADPDTGAVIQSEALRQAGVGRLYTYLVALVALGVLATGVAGLLWTLGDVVFSAFVWAATNDS